MKMDYTFKCSQGTYLANMQHGKRKVLEGSWKYTGAYPTLDQKEILQNGC